MIRYHCDICAQEIPASLIDTQPVLVSDVPHGAGRGLSTVNVQIMRAINGGAMNSGHICGDCLSVALRAIAVQLERVQARGE